MVVVMYLIFIVSALCHFNCLVAFIKFYLILSYITNIANNDRSNECKLADQWLLQGSRQCRHASTCELFPAVLQATAEIPGLR